MSSIFYFFRESLTGFTRNLSTTLGSIITIFLSLLIIGIFCIAGAVVNNVVASVENQVSITAYVKDDASDADIEKVMKTIEGYDGVESVSFTTKDQALDNFRKSTSNPEIVDQLDGDNPLPASIDVQLDDAQSVQNIASEILANQDFVDICDNADDPTDSLQYGQKTVDKLFSLTNAIRTAGIALIALLIFIAFIFINNTIYGMTGGQMAPTTLPGQVTQTTPFGRDPKVAGYPVMVCEMLSQLTGTAYAERVSVDSPAHINAAKKAIRKGFEVQKNKQGFSIIEVLSTCPTNWGMTPLEAMERVRTEMIPYYPLGVYKDITAENK